MEAEGILPAKRPFGMTNVKGEWRDGLPLVPNQRVYVSMEGRTSPPVMPGEGARRSIVRLRLLVVFVGFRNSRLVSRE
jgi:hypothetical protein